VGYSLVDVFDLEPGGPGGMVRFVRKNLGAKAFGFNWFELPPDVVGREHDHADDRQEEVLLVIDGSGMLRIDSEEVPLRRGRFVRIDPESTRCPVAGPGGLTFVTFGAPVEGPYEPPPWG
jgi:quercetin dioxygenase-like cupin family protein